MNIWMTAAIVGEMMGVEGALMGGVAGVFKTAGNIPAALETYDATVNAGPLTAASSM